MKNRFPVQLIPQSRMQKGWRLEWKRGGEALLKVPKALIQAPEIIRQSLLGWANTILQGRRTNALQRRRYETEIHAWLTAQHAENPQQIKRQKQKANRALLRLKPQGKVHDLQAIFQAINAEYFQGKIEAKVTWSARWGGLSTQSTRHDGEGKAYHLIRISRGYDHPSASAEIVGGVVYHECLHIHMPPQMKQGKRVVHGREFKRLEKEYRHYAHWRKWHREVLPHIIRRKPDG